jgi:histidyl-tRNA synthetase
MSRPRALSGFPEWLPPQRAVEHLITTSIERTFALHGFSSMRTRSVEPVAVLTGNGEADKEIYGLRRLRQDDNDPGDGGLGLHFDLTVPLARYVTENAGRLTFPLRRSQVQPVWRGERPQEGRFREFVQADIDVVGDTNLPFHHDVEVALAAAEALDALPIPPVRMMVNNRRLAEGFYRAVGLGDVGAVLRAVDKLAKVGPDGVRAELAESVDASHTQVQACLDFAAVRTQPGAAAAEVRARIHDLHASHAPATSPEAEALLAQGLDEVCEVLVALEEAVPGVAVADMSVARGLDYYTGTVFETELEGLTSLGSICSGGRYENLASTGERRFPGVGISIGVTRLVAAVTAAGLVAATRHVPTCVLVAVNAEPDRAASDAVARMLRRRGIAAEVSPSAAKYGKQIRYADRRGIPFVWFPAPADDRSDGPAHAADDPRAAGQVKDIRSGEQTSASALDWVPPSADLLPRLVSASP